MILLFLLHLNLLFCSHSRRSKYMYCNSKEQLGACSIKSQITDKCQREMISNFRYAYCLHDRLSCSDHGEVKGQIKEITMMRKRWNAHKQNVYCCLVSRWFVHVSFSGWPFSNCGPWGRRTASAPSWDSLPPNRPAARRHELRSYGPMRSHTWKRNRKGEETMI